MGRHGSGLQFPPRHSKFSTASPFNFASAYSDLSSSSALQTLQAMVKEATAAFHRCLYQLPSGALVTKSFPVLSQTFASSASPSYEMSDPYRKFLTGWGDGSLGKASTIPVFIGCKGEAGEAQDAHGSDALQHATNCKRARRFCFKQSRK